MHIYIVSFGIAECEVSGAGCDERRELLMDMLAFESPTFWSETTSFCIAKSEQSTDAFGIYLAAALSPEHDALFILDPADQSAAFFGNVQDPALLQSFFPDLHRLS